MNPLELIISWPQQLSTFEGEHHSCMICVNSPYQRRLSQNYSINHRQTGTRAGEILEERVLLAELDSLVVFKTVA